MEAVVDRPVAAETENQPTPAAGESKSRAMKLSRTSSFDSDEVYSDTDTDTDVNVENQRLYELPNSNDFYCPNCVSNISKVIILRNPPSPLLISAARESSCSPDLIPKLQPRSHVELCSISAQCSGNVYITFVSSRPEPRYCFEIVKSIVYGGLTEAITSLGIVTSAASANIPIEITGALVLANMIIGLIVLTKNFSTLKSNQPKKYPYRRKRPQVDPYEEAFGDRQNYLLHYSAIILSFLLIGLLPPLVYSFSFRHTDGNNLKLAIVGVTSLLCIALLAIAKAYVRKPLHKYVKTLVCYIVLGLGVFGLSYLGGKVLGKLLEPLGSHFVAL
ncbi:Membrane protein of ER body 1, partial [Cucurbita argyrosperma subsp. sororia]